MRAAAIETTRRLTLLKVTLAVIFWGASFIATKIALRDIPPVTVVWLRFGLGVIVLGTAVSVRRELKMPERRDLAYFAFLGFLGITFHQWLQSTGLQTARASTTSWIVATTPIFIAILGRLLLGERLGWLRSAGIGLAAWGVLLVVTGGDFRPLFSGHFGSQGDILILISAVNWAVFTTFSRSGLQRHPAARMMFFVMVAGWIFTTLLFLPQASWNEIAQLSPEGWASILFLGLFCSGLAYIFWYDALQNIPASQAGAFLYLEPLVTLVLSALILLEDVTWVSATGGATILLGVWLVNRRTVRE